MSLTDVSTAGTYAQQHEELSRAGHDRYDDFLSEMHSALPKQSQGSKSTIRRQSQAAITPNDIVIAVMGVTGAGKSTFVSHFCSQAKVGSGLRSCTERVESFLCPDFELPRGKRLYMVDTPGFDDSGSGKTDTDILRDIAAFLIETYQNSVLLTGIIYLHRISDNRVGGSGLRQMKMFRKLCGERSMANVVIATTMWNSTTDEVGEQREQELKTEDGFFKQMMRNGAKMVRQDRDKDSATEIVTRLIETSRPGAFHIQREMVDECKRLDETAAGQVVEAELARMREKHEKELKGLREEMQDALKQKDYALAQEIGNVKADVERRLKQEQEASRRMQQGHESLMQQMRNSHEMQQSYIQDLLDSQTREKNELARELRNATQTSTQLEQEKSKRQALQNQVSTLERQVERARSIAHSTLDAASVVAQSVFGWRCFGCGTENQWVRGVNGWAQCRRCNRSQGFVS